MTKWIELEEKELEVLRKHCFSSLFTSEEIAYSGIESEYTESEQHEALNLVKINHMLISKLHVH